MRTHIPLWRVRQHSLALSLLIAVSLVMTIRSPQPASAVDRTDPNFVMETYIDNSMLADPTKPLQQITAIAWLPQSAGGLALIAQKRGSVRVFNPATGKVLGNRFISIEGETNSSSDRGLLGLAVDPDFPTRPYIYLLYTYDPPELPCTTNLGTKVDCPDGQGARVARLMRVEADPAPANGGPAYSVAKSTAAAPRVILLGKNSTYVNIGAPDKKPFEFPPPNTTLASCDTGGLPGVPTHPVEDCLAEDSRTHTIGTVMFGPDKTLYVSNGDGSEYNYADPRALRSQDLNSLSGKVLRINRDTGAGIADNPFYDAANPNSNRSKVWMYGLRNPFRITVHPTTGEVYVGDVGWNVWEEINMGKGKNFGWPCYEGVGRQPAYENDTITGSSCASVYAAQPPYAATPPIYTYNQGLYNGNGAAMAGAVYTGGSNYPAQYNGVLFIGDYALDRIEYIKFGSPEPFYPFATDVSDRPTVSYERAIVQMVNGPDGNLYYVIFDNKGINDEVRRIRYLPPNTNRPPVARFSATPTNGPAPLTVTFDASSSTDADGDTLSYSWDFGDGQTATGMLVSHSFASGDYSVRLTVTDPSNASSSKNETISAGNTPPTVTISTPTDNTYFNIGDVIAFSGTASDQQESGITAADIHWSAILHHDDHTHPIFEEVVGASSELDIENHADAMWVELCAQVSDSRGLTDEKCVDLLPNRVTYTFVSEPLGRTIVYEGIERTTPFSVNSIVGAEQQISTAASQNGYTFVKWDDGPTTPNRTINMGSTPRTITAIFAKNPNTVTYTYTSQPPGLEIVYDGVVKTTPFEISAAEGSTHQLSVSPNQNGFSFSKWEDNSTATSRVITIGASPKTITASFKPQQAATVSYTFTSEPSGIVIMVGTTARVTPFSVALPVGGTQQISVSEPQKQLSFAHWEDNSTAKQRTLSIGSTPKTIVATFADQPNRAVYEFTTLPAGLPLIFDGQQQVTPFGVVLEVGSSKTVSASIQPNGLMLSRWEDDSTNPDRTLTIVKGPKTITAFFEWRLFMPIIKR